MPLDPDEAHALDALLRLPRSGPVRVALSPMGQVESPGWAAVLRTLPRGLQDEQGWSGSTPARTVWLPAAGQPAQARLSADACTLVLEPATAAPPLIPPTRAVLADLAVQLCRLLDARFDVRSRVRAADPLTRTLSQMWSAMGADEVEPSLVHAEGFQEVHARLVTDRDGQRWLRWPWRGPEHGTAGLVEVPIDDAPPPELSEAVRTAAEALGRQADVDHLRRLQARDRRFLKTVLTMSHDGLIAATAEGDVVFYNDTLRGISSWTREEVVEHGWAPLVYPDPAYRARMLEWIRRHFVGEQFEAQSVSLARRDGSRASCLLRTRVTHDERGMVVAMGAFRDVTALREAEALRARERSLDGLGRLASTVAHDVRNLLAGVMGHANLLELEGGEVAERAARIAAAAERGDAMTRRLLSFGGTRPTHMRAVDLAALVAELVRSREAARSDGPVFERVIAADLPSAQADADLVAEAVENLLVNAEQMDGVGHVRVEVGLGKVPPAPSSASPTLRGECLRIRVADDGPGFSAEARAHLFQPFWSSRPGGHGIGLAAVRSLLATLGGAVDVPVDVQGGVVDVLLPLSTEAPPAPAPRRPALPRGEEAVWVIDDEPELVELLCASLDMLGYHTRGFTSGRAALEALDAGERPDLFTLDVRMPDMDGPTVHAALRRRGLRAPVLFCSGMADVPLPEDERMALLEKPFKLAALAAEVRRLIDRWVLIRQPPPQA
jgi:PAS domain S-box-containing protein